MERADLRSVAVRPAMGNERDNWDQLMREHHYLGLRHLVGESIRYMALMNGEVVALLGWTSAAYKSGPRDSWIGWDEDTRHKRLIFLANNSRFLILPGVHIKNLASRILALNLKRLPEDWLNAYGHPVCLAETFVDQKRFSGACYRAASFIELGQTRGFRRNAGYYYPHGDVKTILVREIHKDALSWLTAPFLSPGLLLGKRPLVDINRLVVNGPGGLTEHLVAVADPRRPRGVRYQQAVTLTMIVCAVVSGASTYKDLSYWSKTLSQETLRKLGSHRGSTVRGWVPPSESTTRRTFQAVDMSDLCQTVTAWLTAQGLSRLIGATTERLRSFRGLDRKVVTVHD